MWTLPPCFQTSAQNTRLDSSLVKCTTRPVKPLACRSDRCAYVPIVHQHHIIKALKSLSMSTRQKFYLSTCSRSWTLHSMLISMVCLSTIRDPTHEGCKVHDWRLSELLLHCHLNVPVRCTTGCRYHTVRKAQGTSGSRLTSAGTSAPSCGHCSCKKRHSALLSWTLKLHSIYITTLKFTNSTM